MEQVSLTSISRPKQWKTISGKDLLESGYPVYGANGKIGFYNSYTHKHPTLLITCRGATCGSINISEPKSYVNGNAMALDNLSEEVDLYYLKYYLEYRKFDDVISGSAQPQITGKGLSKVKIPLPPLDQQKKIAAILNAGDAYKQKTKALIEKYDALTQSLFLDMFGDPVTNPNGWITIAIKEVCTLQGGYSFKSKDFVSEGVKLVKIANVHFEDMVWDDVDFLPSDFLDKYFKFSLNEGDILMALTRPIIKSLGTVKAITVNQSDLPCLLNQRVARFIPNKKKLHKSYLLRYIYGSYFKNKIERYSSTSLQPNVSTNQIEEIKIMLPPIELQNQFAERVQVIESQKSQAQASLAQAEDLFNSLLQRAFKGELTS
jgi:type I restriction enzyme S subunit